MAYLASNLAHWSLFGMLHPEVAPWMVLFIGTFTTCQGLINDTNDLGVMYRHIFGDEAKGQKPCRRCKEALERNIEHQKKWISPE